jgi:ectoine hydroxylase-related dioxygenase (phytanoyl-CoA dioxygenase family)
LQRLREILNSGDLKWISAYLSTKPPHSPVLWWHQDWWCWDHPISFYRTAPQVALLCYLTDTNKQNGALRTLPGSHHSSNTMHRVLPEPHGEIANALPTGHPALADLAEQITIDLQAGDAVVLDYRLLHGTHANDTPKRRDCILLSFIPTWNVLPREIKAHLILHPALPDETEAKYRSASCYDDILPRFEGSPASLSINRVPPETFTISHSRSIDC